jgi:DNA repair exonuclease SbcCD ATPase subunit
MLGRMSSIFSPLALTNNTITNRHPNHEDDASEGVIENSANLEQDEEEEDFSVDGATKAGAMTQLCIQDSSSDDNSDVDDDKLDNAKHVLKVSPPSATKKKSPTKRKPDCTKPSPAKAKKVKPTIEESANEIASHAGKVNGTPKAKGKNTKSPPLPPPSEATKSTAAGNKQGNEKEDKPMNPKATITPTPKKKRLTPLEQAETTSLQAVQALVDVSKQVLKSRQDHLRQLQKDVKTKQQELEQLQKTLNHEQTAVEDALQCKRAAIQQYKALERQWTKAKEAHMTQFSKAVAVAEKKLLQEQKRLVVKSEADETPAKKQKAKGKSPCPKRRVTHNNGDDDDSSDTDSDWEGKVVGSATATKTTRVTTLRQKVSQWSCSTCTFKNSMSRKKCEMCSTLRNGVLPDDDDLEDDE